VALLERQRFACLDAIVDTLSTPGGIRSPISSISTWIDSGVCSAG